MIQSLQLIENTSLTTISEQQSDEITQDDNLNPLPYFEESVLKSYRAKNYQKCIKTIERILKVTPKEEAIHYKILQAAANTMLGKDLKKSHSILDKVLKHNPKDSYALYGKATAYYFQGDFDKSIEMLDKAIEANDDEMERAKNLKIRVEMERTRLKVVLEKIDVKINDFSEEENEIKKEEIFQEIKEIKGEILENSPKSKNFKNSRNFKNVQKSNLDSLKLRQNNLVAKIKTRKNLNNSKYAEFNSSELKFNEINSGMLQQSEGNSNLENLNFFGVENGVNDESLLKSLQNPDLPPNSQNITEEPMDVDDYDPKPNLMPKISSNSPAQECFNKGLDLYMSGNLRKSLKYFEKALKLESDFEEADEMGTKVQELIELMDLIEINLSQKNYEMVVEIITQAIDVDDGNDNVNKTLYFKRGLAYFHMKENEKSLKDYAEFERLKKKLGES